MNRSVVSLRIDRKRGGMRMKNDTALKLIKAKTQK